METVIVEIRSAEGGDDAKLFTLNIYKVLTKYCMSHKWSIELLEMKPSSIGYQEIDILVSGNNVYKSLIQEAGGHRVQRVPPTEKKGRRQTSTITVAVLLEPERDDLIISQSDLKIETMRGSGPGGQHRNTTDSAVRITHIPTGISAYAAEKSQIANRKNAMSVLRSRLNQIQHASIKNKIASDRKKMVGTGMRGDKIRTIRYQDGLVMDHRNGKKIQLSKWLEGMLDLLHD